MTSARSSPRALVGYAQFGALGIPEVDARPGDRGFHRLYVAPEWQRRGVGRSLTEAVLRHPRLAGADRIFLQVWEENGRAVRLYEGLGFGRFGTTTFTVGRRVMEDLVMVRARRGRL